MSDKKVEEPVVYTKKYLVQIVLKSGVAIEQWYKKFDIQQSHADDGYPMVSSMNTVVLDGQPKRLFIDMREIAAIVILDTKELDKYEG